MEIIHITIIMAVAVPVCTFASAWGGIKYASKQFRQDIEGLRKNMARLEERLRTDELHYVEEKDCKAIRDDCMAVHRADERTVCAKIDHLVEKVGAISEAQAKQVEAIQNLALTIARLEESRRVGG